MTPDLRPLPPKDAIAFFRSKGLKVGFSYQDVWQEEHAKAFTVAKAMSLDLLEDIREALDQAQAEGQTPEMFQKKLAPILQAKGWWGRQLMGDPLTGEIEVVQLGSSRRLRTIFQTNMRQAYNAGNWQRAWATRADLPFMIYHHNDVRFPRPEHEAWDRVCLPVEHPWWKTHYPQCAWGCKCSTSSASASMLRSMGIKVTRDQDIPRFPVKEFVNSRTGEVSQVEQGIDPAFNFNIGQAPLRPITARPEQIDRNRPVKDIEATVKPFFDAAGVSPDAKSPLQDKTGWPLAINRLLFEDPTGKPTLPRGDIGMLPLAGAALKAPDNVEWRWKSEITAQADRRALDAVLKDVTTPGDPKWVQRLDKIVPAVVKAAASQGIDIAGYSHEIVAKNVRHIFNEHGPLGRKTRDGALPVLEDDIRRLPAILRAPDGLIFGLSDDRGFPAIAVLKESPQDVMIYIVTLGKWRLRTKTVYKRPAGTDFEALRRSLQPYVQNGSGDPTKLVDLRGKIKPAREVLVRRYTKVIDNREVTVDFSDGTWTYDVRALNGG